MAKIYKGDIGTKIRLNARYDISGADTPEKRKIKYKKPDGTTGEWQAVIEGTQYAYYLTQSGDLNVAGKWDVQIYVVLSAWSGHGLVASFEVFETLT